MNVIIINKIAVTGTTSATPMPSVSSVYIKVVHYTLYYSLDHLYIPVLIGVRTVSGGSLYGPVPPSLTAATAIVYLVDGVSPVMLCIL